MFRWRSWCCRHESTALTTGFRVVYDGRELAMVLISYLWRFCSANCTVAKSIAKLCTGHVKLKPYPALLRHNLDARITWAGTQDVTVS